MREEGFREARALYEEAGVGMTVSLSYVEARAALAAARRARRVSAGGSIRARAELEQRWQELLIVDIDDRLVAEGGDIAEEHRLRSHDALHLAAALSIGDEGLVVASWDRELRRAAEEAGLAVAP